jgi:hypothetical protein
MKRILLVASVALAVAAYLAVGGAGAAPSSKAAFPNLKNPLFAVLKGGNEIKSQTAPHGGDPDGRGSATVLAARQPNLICFAITVRGLGQPVAAHIHRGPAGVNGPVVVPFTAPATGDPGAISGCVNADPKLIKDIQQHPSEYYVNVHTTEFPGGAVRGQLELAP